MPTLEAEPPAPFDPEGEYRRSLEIMQGVFDANAAAVVPLNEGSSLLVGNVIAFTSHGAPAEAYTQRIDILRTTADGVGTTYGYTVRHLINEGDEVGAPLRGSLFTGFDYERAAGFTEEGHHHLRHWLGAGSIPTYYSEFEALLVAPGISGENVLAAAANEVPAAEDCNGGRLVRRRLRVSNFFRFPGKQHDQDDAG